VRASSYECPKGPSISGNLCPKLDVDDFERRKGQFIPALLVVTTLSCGNLHDGDMARVAKPETAAKLSPIRSHSL